MKLHYWEAFCSVPVVGLGQILKGESRKGVALLLAFYFFLPALFYSSLLFNNAYPVFALGLALVSGIIIWAFSVINALVG